MKICPYCNEKISDEAITCPICGEAMKTEIKMDYRILKKILLCFVILLLAVAGWFLSTKFVAADDAKIIEYKSIHDGLYVTDLSPLACVKKIVEIEADLKEYLEQGHSKKDNDKLFSLFYMNLNGYKSRFASVISESRYEYDYRYGYVMNSHYTTLEKFGIKLESAGNEASGEYKILSPRTDLVYSKDWGGTDGFSINYDYLSKTYGKYLSSAWIDCLEMEKVDDEKTYYSDLPWENFQKERYEKWGKFIKMNPRFAYNYRIEENRKSYAKDANITYAPAK